MGLRLRSGARLRGEPRNAPDPPLPPNFILLSAPKCGHNAAPDGMSQNSMYMTKTSLLVATASLALWLGFEKDSAHAAAGALARTLPVPRFSTNYMDLSVSPSTDFFHYANGAWLKANPVPADKSRWSGFEELQERNWHLLHDILESTLTNRPADTHSPAAEVSAFYASAMDANALEKLGFKPLYADFDRIAALKSPPEVLRLLADFQNRDISALFDSGVGPDARNSGFYAFAIGQGGLGLPDRDYYLTDGFADKRAAYQVHIAKMLALTGEADADAKSDAAKILELETALAKAGKARADLRDPIANYHKFTVAEAVAQYPNLPLRAYLDSVGLPSLNEFIIEQPEFFPRWTPCSGNVPSTTGKSICAGTCCCPLLLIFRRRRKTSTSPFTARFCAASHNKSRAGSAPRAWWTPISARRWASFTSRRIFRRRPRPAWRNWWRTSRASSTTIWKKSPG